MRSLQIEPSFARLNDEGLDRGEDRGVEPMLYVRQAVTTESAILRTLNHLLITKYPQVPRDGGLREIQHVDQLVHRPLTILSCPEKMDDPQANRLVQRTKGVDQIGELHIFDIANILETVKREHGSLLNAIRRVRNLPPMRMRWIALGCVVMLACGDDDAGVDGGLDAARDAARDGASLDTGVDSGTDTGSSDAAMGDDTGACALRCGDECVDSCADCPGAPLECDGTCVSNCDGENCPVGVAMRDSFACGDRCVPFPFCCPCEGDAYRCRDGSCVDDCSTCSGQRDNCEFGYCTVGSDDTSCRPTEASCEGCPEGTSICNGTCVDDCAECPDHTFSCAPRIGTWPHCREDIWDCDSPPVGQVRCPDGSVEDACTACDGDALKKCNIGGWCVEACEDCALTRRPEPDECGSLCVDFQFDDMNCGECGLDCLASGPPFLSCISGECLEL